VPAQPVFYYDLGSPECYLAAEQVMTALPVVPEWEPVLETSLTSDLPPVDRADIERRAGELGLQPIRWPPRLPADTRQAMLAATYAKRVGRAVAFSLAAFRQAFAGGRDLGEESTVLIAGAATEMHPAALLKAMGLRSVTEGLEAAGRRAAAQGVAELPAIATGSHLFCGPGAVAAVAALLGSHHAG
jgi:2-hydroxychromene-2-carboxylate isomerase